MKNVNHCMLRAVQVTACALLGWTGCAGSTSNQDLAAPTQSTTSAAVPTANGTYDRSMDPGASNASGGTTAMPMTTPIATNAAILVDTTPPPEAPLTDGQIALIVSDVDRSEIDAGKLAQSHGQSAKVRQFGHQMVTAHSAVEAQLNTLVKAQSISPADSSISTQLKDQSQTTNQSLMGQSGTDFDRAYLAAQIQGHQDVLQLLDNKLIPQAQNPKLKADLEGIRTKVVGHIQMAKDARAALPSP
jgi:putative membrane protein